MTSRLFIFVLFLVFSVLTAFAQGTPENSFFVGSWEYDRGNLLCQSKGQGYADAEPVVINAELYPNLGEYDIDFPLTSQWTIWVRYAAEQPRPVEILLDGNVLMVGIDGATGSWQASTARWEKQITVPIAKGRHTIALRRDSCIPHIVGMRFQPAEPLPADFKRKPRPIPEMPPNWSGKPELGKLGYDAYIRADGSVDAPSDYDPTVPFALVPAPAPRAERMLEYLLMGEGKYNLEASFAPDEISDVWVAELNLQINPQRLEHDILTLDPVRVEKILDHARFLSERFRQRPQLMASLEPLPLDDMNRWSEMTAQADKLIAELKNLSLPVKNKATAEKLYSIYTRAYCLKNRVALSNPQINFSQLLVTRRLTYDTSHIYTTYFDGSHRYGGNLAMLSPVRPDGEMKPIETGLPNPAIYRDADLSWDAKKLVFSYKPDLATPCHIFEINTDGTGLRQLTNSEYDDIDPCYLPDGRIMFVSTRCQRVVLCSNVFTVSVLYTMNADGSNVQCVSQNTVNDFTPSVMHDGRVAYTKWEYVDKQLGNNQSMWLVNPDGSNPRAIAGEHWGPITLWEPRQVPGSNLLITTLAPHMPIAVGPIALVDPNDVCTSPAKFENITNEIPPPKHFGWQRPSMGYYCNPYPLSEDFYVVSYAWGPDDREPAGYGLYLLDRWNNRDLIYRDPDISCFEALPVAPRPVPPVLPETTVGQSDEGTLCVLDIYKGMPGVKRGSIKYLRVVQEIPKPVSAECSGPWLQYPVISHAAHLAIKKLLGVVPVEEDGSVYFKVPANKGIYFSALDENYMEVQRMRALTEVRPGETISCVGCHDERTSAPSTRRGMAFSRPASNIEPPPQGANAIDYMRDVQPVLTQNCTSCHSGKTPAGGLNLSPAKTIMFNVAYENMLQKGYIKAVIANESSTLPLRPPMFYGSHASKLITTLQETHTDRVKLSEADWRSLVTWVDMNAPYYATYIYTRPNTLGGRELLTPGIRSRLGGIFNTSCASCHGADVSRIERINYEDVMQSPALLAPMAKSAGGTGECGEVFKSQTDPAALALKAVLEELQQELKDNPREDMWINRPPILAENPRYVFRP